MWLRLFEVFLSGNVSVAEVVRLLVCPCCWDTFERLWEHLHVLHLFEKHSRCSVELQNECNPRSACARKPLNPSNAQQLNTFPCCRLHAHNRFFWKRLRTHIFSHQCCECFHLSFPMEVSTWIAEDQTNPHSFSSERREHHQIWFSVDPVPLEDGARWEICHREATTYWMLKVSQLWSK